MAAECHNRRGRWNGGCVEGTRSRRQAKIYTLLRCDQNGGWLGKRWKTRALNESEEETRKVNHARIGVCSARPCNSDGGAQSTRPSLWRRAGVGGSGGGGEGRDNRRAHAFVWEMAFVGNRFGQAAGGEKGQQGICRLLPTRELIGPRKADSVPSAQVLSQ